MSHLTAFDERLVNRLLIEIRRGGYFRRLIDEGHFPVVVGRDFLDAIDALEDRICALEERLVP